jgi:hypothetical protein
VRRSAGIVMTPFAVNLLPLVLRVVSSTGQITG